MGHRTDSSRTWRILERTTSSLSGSVASNLHSVTASAMQCMASAASGLCSLMSPCFRTLCTADRAILRGKRWDGVDVSGGALGHF